ncbi:hypothetical protein PINS_up005929 [Pythium insidiosum]|nr:hypothetical protein PINS_up005929 [Pythium insidiosum]
MTPARADLAQRRQRMRVDENATVNAADRKDASWSSARPKGASKSPPEAEKRRVKRVSKTAAETRPTCASTAVAIGKQSQQQQQQQTNSSIALAIRQVLQKKLCGNVGEYLAAHSKGELFEVLHRVAEHAFEMKERQREFAEALEKELLAEQTRRSELASELLHTQAEKHAAVEARDGMERRLQTASEEYRSIVSVLRDYDERWQSTESTLAQQTQLLQEMSRTLEERSRQVDGLAAELEIAQQSAQELRQALTEANNQLEVQRLDAERIHQQHETERRENKSLAWELQDKTSQLEQLTAKCEDTKSQVVTLQGQLQILNTTVPERNVWLLEVLGMDAVVELITNKSLTKERDAAYELHRREREDWRAAEENRMEFDRLKAQEFRSMDLELRQLRQAVSRLRVDLETERSHREKAEATALKVTELADELKATARELQHDVKRLSMELQEERSTRETKEGALANAYRELQSLHKRLREEETARIDATNEVEALQHRMTLIRRDHLALLHRVETPPQVAARWHSDA